MTPEASNNYQNLVIALFIGLALPPALGFLTGFWVTRDNAAQKVNEAVLTARTTICIAQFINSPNYQEGLKQYLGLDYSAKGNFLEKGGWAKMPGEQKANDAVKEACARKIESLTQ